MKNWKSWKKWGMIGLIIGLIYPTLFFSGYSVDLLAVLLYPVVFIVAIISPDTSSLFTIALWMTPVFYLVLGVLFGLLVGKAKRKKAVAATSWISEANIVDTIGEHAAGYNNNNEDLFPVAFPMEEINVRTYRDTDEPLADYKTFDFDYTNKTNPLLEKELFRDLEKILLSQGMTRAKKNPQTVISMDFFSGKKEQYTPPTTITSTEVKYDWNIVTLGDSWGGMTSAVPITSSRTTPGYTTTTFYSNIRLNFLNHAKLASGKKLEIPPMIWMGEADNEGLDPDIRGIAPVMLAELIGEFPEKSDKSPKRRVCRSRYSGLGLGFGPKDWRLINHVEPHSVAAENGINPGDFILKINGKNVGNWPVYNRSYTGDPARYRAKDPYFQDVLANKKNSEVELVIKSAETGKKITVKMRPRREDRYINVNLTTGAPASAQGDAVAALIGVPLALAIVYFILKYVL
ncbi:MAG: PDZ domain-containing protein [Candidatus Paceibacterota bacterium]|jgi:hypothetical protein